MSHINNPKRICGKHKWLGRSPPYTHIELSLKKMAYLLQGLIEVILRDSTGTKKGIWLVFELS